MQPSHEDHHIPEPKKNWWLTLPGLLVIITLGAIAYTLIIDHRQHLAENWILLVLLLCPAMHLFMHHGHDHPPKDGDKE